ncbi:lactate dehydrogenase superfamily protein [Emydomyces testavorans]|uniref:Lactate dehydrogenase superfamily protein n=1 Tax=Emydomyces testavorans TaxID=2070801 RepID=A0AAF0IGU9_9EURO|nr:lactate dehydrogenase superfamily protein [Emydomyces testavorans]
MSTGPDSRKPTLLFVGEPVLEPNREKWTKFSQSFNIIPYTRTTKEDLLASLKPGGKYSQIDGIIRASNTSNNLPGFDKEFISHLPPSLKIIASVNHGYDREDTEELGRRGIWYCNGAGGANDSTADLALFLIIAAFRHTSFCEHTLRTIRKGDYFAVEKDVVKTSHNPRDKVLGVVGMGQVGLASAARAKALGMKIHYFGRTRKSPEVEQQAGGAVYHSTLESMLAVADCVLLACPHSPETHHLLNKETFKLVKRGVRVVNVARGKCIDEEALADAIDEGIVGGVGLDVYHDEYAVPVRFFYFDELSSC